MILPYPLSIAENIEDLVCGYHLAVIQASHKLNGKFLFRAIQSTGIKDQFYRLATGITRFGLKVRELESVLIPLPPPFEQKKIAEYLDQQCGKLDAIIAIKQQQIKTLDALRQSIIYQAVTKGLDVSVPLVDSGVEWLGKTPRHWPIRRIKDIAELKSGDGIKAEDISATGNYPVFGGNSLRGYTSSFTHDGYHVLIGRQGALCGNINYAKGKFWATEHAVVVTLYRSFNTFWLGELLRSMNLNQYSNPAAQPGLSIDKIQFLKLPMPPIEEQKAVAIYLDEEIDRINRLKVNLTQQISTLEAYKKSLIYECVTGKKRIKTNA